jgi:hypothetical protein
VSGLDELDDDEDDGKRLKTGRADDVKRGMQVRQSQRSHLFRSLSHEAAIKAKKTRSMILTCSNDPQHFTVSSIATAQV